MVTLFAGTPNRFASPLADNPSSSSSPRTTSQGIRETGHRVAMVSSHPLGIGRCEMSVDDNWRTEVWHGLLDGVWLARGFQRQHQRHLAYHRLLRTALALSATGLVAVLVNLVPVEWADSASLALGGIVLLAVIVDLVMQLPEKAAVLHSISVDLARLETEWRQLWLATDAENPDTPLAEIQQRYAQLKERELRTVSRTGDAHIPENASLFQRCWEDVVEMEPRRYAQQAT